MRISLDTASVTDLLEGLEEIFSIMPGDVSLEVVASDFEAMIGEGKERAQVRGE